MKKYLVLALFLTLFASSLITAQTEPEVTPEVEPETDIEMPIDVDDIPEGWELVWNDEFTEPEIDPKKWGYDTGGTGFGNNELQYYSDEPENAYIDDGNLVIEALEGRYMGLPYSSAKLRTLVLADWVYGRIDIRAQMPYGQGMWPAFWMLPIQGTYGSWPSSGEIDIMEYLGHDTDRVYGTLHYGSSGDHQSSGTYYTLDEGTFADDFHVFSLIWEPDRFQWFVDGIQYQELTEWNTRNADYPAPFDQAFYLILNLAVGGNWPGNPDETTEFPQRLTVDYVRVYQVPDGE